MNIIQPSMSWREYFMRHVYLAASRSKDPRTKIGAVLVKDGTIISEGYNGLPRGVNDLEERLIDRETKYKWVVHGEHNAVLNCARHGINTVGSDIYTQGIPCNECAKAIIQAGCSTVVVHTQWPSMPGSKWAEAAKISYDMFLEAGLDIVRFDRVLGLQGFRDGKVVDV